MMDNKDTLDLISSDDPDMVLIAALSSLIKALRLSARNHEIQCKAALSRAETSERNGDHEAYHYWLNVSLDEDNSYRNIIETLQQFSINDKGCKEL